MVERRKVESGLNTPIARTQTKLNLESFVKPRAAFNVETSGFETAKALVQFAGGEYAEHLEKKIDKDKVVQTGRFLAGMQPTDKATLAGYKAHAALATKAKVIESQAKLSELATMDITDEEWDSAVESNVSGLDEYMAENYELYAKDNDMQKLAFNSMREMMPSVVARREAYKLKFEINKRIETATDYIMNTSDTLNSLDTKESVEIMDDYIGSLFGSLQLTESQKETAIVTAIANTKNKNLIEYSKKYKGGRETSLYERTGAIQQLEAKLQKKDMIVSTTEIVKRRRELEKSFIGDPENGIEPIMSEEEAYKFIDVNNGVFNNKFMSPEQVLSMFEDRDKAIAANHEQRIIMAKIQDDATADLSGHKQKKVQATFEGMYESGVNDILEASEEVQEEERQEFIERERQALIANLADKSVKSDTPIKKWVAELNNFATLNIPAQILEAPGEYGLEALPVYAQEAVYKLTNMPEVARDEYIQELDSKSAKITRAFMHFKETGIPVVQALDKAQRYGANPVPVSQKKVREGIAKVRENLEDYWWNADIPDAQSSYIEQELYNKLAYEVDPSTGSSVNLVTNWMNERWTNSDGLRLKGSKNQLETQLGVHHTRFKKTFDYAKNHMKKSILSKVSGLGLTLDDVFPITDPKRQTVRFVTSNGDWASPTIKMSEIPKMARQEKVKVERKMYGWDKPSFMTITKEKLEETKGRVIVRKPIK